MQKLFLFLFLLPVLFTVAHAQSIELRAGSNGMPGNFISIGYEHYSNWPFNISGKLFAEGSTIHGLLYKAYGIDLLGEYGSKQDDNAESIFAFRIGLGVTCQIESEPWVYNWLSAVKRMNYGFIGVASGEWWMSENFCLSVFGQQKWLFNSALGSRRSAFGLGLKFRLNNY